MPRFAPGTWSGSGLQGETLKDRWAGELKTLRSGDPEDPEIAAFWRRLRGASGITREEVLGMELKEYFVRTILGVMRPRPESWGSDFVGKGLGPVVLNDDQAQIDSPRPDGSIGAHWLIREHGEWRYNGRTVDVGTRSLPPPRK